MSGLIGIRNFFIRVTGKKDNLIWSFWYFLILLFLGALINNNSINAKCSDGICFTEPMVILVSFLIGLMFALDPFAKLRIRKIFLAVLLLGLFAFASDVVGQALWAIEALKNPRRFPGLFYTGAPVYGIWFTLYEPETYYILVYTSLATLMGCGIGSGLRAITKTIIKKIQPNKARLSI